MQSDPKQEERKQVAFSQGMVQQWLESDGKTPKQVLDAFKQVSEGYDRLRKELEDQAAKHQQELKHAKMLSDLSESQATLAKAKALQSPVNDSNDIDDLNDGTDEQRITVGEFRGWNMVGGIRFGKAAVVNDLNDWSPLLKVLIAPMRRDFVTDYDVFPLAVKRGSDGSIEKFVVDFTKTLK
jgi:hypothetical protein